MKDVIKLGLVLFAIYEIGGFFINIHKINMCMSVVRCGPVNSIPNYW